MDFINKIGQRNCAKILILIAACTCFLGFILEKNTDMKNLIFGISLFILPNIILYFITSKNKDYRLFSLIASFFLLILNNLLFFINFKLALFLSLMIQIIATSVFYFFIHNLETRKKLAQKNQRRKVKASGTASVMKEETLNSDLESNSNTNE